MAHIPQELITEILELLPAKPLLRFRCLSKSLCSIIGCPSFVNSRLAKTSNNRSNRKIIIDDLTRLSEPIHVLDIDDNFIPFPPPEPDEEYPYYKFAHCNGLVLQYQTDDPCSLTLWNPSTKETRKLSILVTGESPKDCLPYDLSGFGIGYDSSIDDYKILVVGIFEDRYAIWVSGLRSFAWRKVVYIPKDLDGKIANFTNCFIDNAFYFLGHNYIWAFDVADETFSRVSLPFRVFGRDVCVMQVVEGCLSVTYYQSDINCYIRKNDGTKFYWTKLFCVTYEQISSVKVGSEISYLGFPNVIGGDGIFVLGFKYVLSLYDCKQRRMKRIVVGDEDKQNVTFCIESLVPVDYPEEFRMTKRRRRT